LGAILGADELNAAIERPVLFSAVVDQGPLEPIAVGRQSAHRDAVRDEVLHDRVGAAIGEVLVVGGGALVIRMALHFDLDGRILLQRVDYGV
jgi:hypothetical protein